MENNRIRYLEEQDRHSDVSSYVEHHEAVRTPNLIVIIDDDDSNVLPIHISSDEEDVENVIVSKDSDEDPEEGRYDGRYEGSLKAEGIEEEHGVAERDEDENKERIPDLIHISSDEEEVDNVIVLEDSDEDPEEGRYDGRNESSLRAEHNEEEEEEDGVAEGEEDGNEEEREEAEDADDESEEEEVDLGEFNGRWLWEEEDSDEFEDDLLELDSIDSGYSTMTSDEEDREDGELDVEGVAPEVILPGGEAAEEHNNIRPPPSDLSPSQNSWSFMRNILGEEAPSTSGLSTSRDRNREDLWGFYVTFLGEVPPMSSLGTSSEEGQLPSHSCIETHDFWSSFGITSQDKAPSTSGLSTSRKRGREEEEQEQEHPAQRPRRASEEDFRDDPTPSTSGSNSCSQGGRYWESIYPRRQEQTAASDGDVLVSLTLREKDEDQDPTPPRSTQGFQNEEERDMHTSDREEDHVVLKAPKNGLLCLLRVDFNQLIIPGGSDTSSPWTPSWFRTANQSPNIQKKSEAPLQAMRSVPKSPVQVKLSL